MVKTCRGFFAVVVLAGNLACALPGTAAKSAATVAGLEAPTPAPAAVPAPVPGTEPELVLVKGGCFQRGSAGQSGGPDEKPRHEVCVGDFWIGRHEVTQEQWQAVMGSNPSHHLACGAKCPVERVSWSDAQDFIAKLNARRTGKAAAAGPFRLPTEAEWEYAARSGGKDEKYAGRSDEIATVAWYLNNSHEPEPGLIGAHPVGVRAPNGLGLYDMTGNVWEWTGDWYDETYYATSPRVDPTGPATGTRRVVRGGSYANESFDLRTAYRNALPPDHRSETRGLRLVQSPSRPAR